jgi:hypothetical protein
MPGKALKRVRTGPLQKYTAVPITDPAEIAEIEEKLKQPESADLAGRKEGEVYLTDFGLARRTRGAGRLSKKATASEVLEQARQLSADEHFLLITELAAQLSPARLRELREQLMALSRPDAHP